MESYISYPETYYLLYGCQELSSVEWEKRGEAHFILGSFSILCGFVYYGLYIPCLIVLKTKAFWKNSCYRIMFFYGLMDQIGIFLNCFVGGTMAMQGYVFCTAPQFVFFCGCVGSFAYGAQLIACILLAINRIIDLWNHDLTLILFDSLRTYVWLLIPLGYGLYSMIRFPPLVFSSLGPTWVADPYFGTEFALNGTTYITFYYSPVNLSLLSALAVMVVAMATMLLFKTFDTEQLASVYKFHKMITKISIALCALLAVPVLGSFLVDHVFSSLVTNAFVFLAMQLNNGIPCLVFMYVNQHIRDNVLGLLPTGCYMNKKDKNVVYVTSQMYGTDKPIVSSANLCHVRTSAASRSDVPYAARTTPALNARGVAS